jgi:hypothetical protein
MIFVIIGADIRVDTSIIGKIERHVRYRILCPDSILCHVDRTIRSYPNHSKIYSQVLTKLATS